MELLLYLLLTLQVLTFKTDDLTEEILTTRTQEQLIIEETTGIILNSAGDGKIDTMDPYYNYISYSDLMDYAEAGQTVTTYFVYNPLNQYEDDIIFRIDFLEDGNVFFESRLEE